MPAIFSRSCVNVRAFWLGAADQRTRLRMRDNGKLFWRVFQNYSRPELGGRLGEQEETGFVRIVDLDTKKNRKCQMLCCGTVWSEWRILASGSSSNGKYKIPHKEEKERILIQKSKKKFILMTTHTRFGQSFRFESRTWLFQSKIISYTWVFHHSFFGFDFRYSSVRCLTISRMKMSWSRVRRRGSRSQRAISYR